MRILMASDYFASHRGGLELVAGELFGALAERGMEVVWMAGDVTPPPLPIGRSHALPLAVFNFVEDRIGVPFPVPAPSTVRKILGEVRKADVLIVHDCLYLSNMLAYFVARLRRIPTVIIQHIGAVPYRNVILKMVMQLGNRIVTRPMLSRAAQVVFICEKTKMFFGHVRYRRDPEVIFNGVETGLFRRVEGADSVSALRRDYGLPEDRAVVLFVGRFVEKKGMTAMKRMVESRPDLTWAFAGWGPLDPSSWNAGNVHVFSGLSGPSLAALYRACDLLVLPSVGEGFPLVIQEALACGLPVVCGKETLTADPAMEPFVRGASVYPGSDENTASEFLRAIDELLASGALSIENSERRRSFAVSRYSWERATDRYLEIISRLVEPDRAPAGEVRRAVGVGRQ